jgi:hypothetical protein
MEYSLEQVKQENLPLYSKLLSEVFPETKKYTTEFLNWQYFKNPAGKVIGFDAFYNGELVAHYVTIPVNYTFNNKVINGLLSLNTATSKQHQGKGLFVKLSSATYELGTKEDYKFVIGVANQNSTHGFIKKLGFELIGKLDVKVFLGSVNPALPNNTFFKSSWNTESVNWRLNCPGAMYYADSNSVYSKTHLPFFKSVLSSLPVFKNNQLNKIGFNPFKISIGLNLNPPTFAINLPEKLKPSPLNLIFKNLSRENLNINKENCYFELIDFDAY